MNRVTKNNKQWYNEEIKMIKNLNNILIRVGKVYSIVLYVKSI